MRRSAFLLLTILAACGRRESTADSANTVHAAPPAASSPASVRETRPAELTAADVAAYERGLARESEAVRAARARERAAATPAERAAATQASWEEATIPEGARAAGMSEERYREVRSTVGEVLRTLDFQGKIDGPLEIDTLNASPAMKAKVARDPFADLTPATAQAIRARLASLTPVWVDYNGLTALFG